MRLSSFTEGQLAEINSDLNRHGTIKALQEKALKGQGPWVPDDYQPSGNELGFHYRESGACKRYRDAWNVRMALLAAVSEAVCA